MSGLRRLSALLRMAVKDLLAEWSVSAAICLAITAVAAPVLVLLALQAGVIGGIFADLRQDPAAREIRLTATGAARFEPSWFAEVSTWPEVAFVAPSTRYASAQGEVYGGNGTTQGRATLLPTGPRDPAFAPDGLRLAGPTEAGISAALARRLQVEAGAEVMLDISRGAPDGSGLDYTAVPLRIVAIAGAAAFGREALFLDRALLDQIEDYRNGHSAPLLGQTEGEAPPPRASYPDFRLYAQDVADVLPLVTRLEAEPYALSLRAETGRIAFAQDLDSGLSLVISAVGVLGVLGLGGGLAAIQWSMAARRRRTIAILALMGFPKPALISLPVLQALILGALGALMTVMVAQLFAHLVDTLLADQLAVGVTRLEPVTMAGVVALVLVLSALPALWIGLRYSRLDPSDEIRES
ncbi:MAG: ABC transporter permease [Rhodospirillaceae bacterium]